MENQTKVNFKEYYSIHDINEEVLFMNWMFNHFNITPDIAYSDQNKNETNRLREEFRHFLSSFSDLPENYLKNALIIIFYSIIIIVSLLGNLLVFKVIVSRITLRRRTTNILILNLSASDLLMTVFAIPIRLVGLIMDDWPLGSFLCSLAPFIQVTSIYVSSLTMTVIALDRYQVIINPMKARVCNKIPKYVLLGLIWIISGGLSIPHSIFNQIRVFFTYRSISRCRTVYPEPQLYSRRLLTVFTFSTQYVIPLSITFLTYGFIAFKMYKKSFIGEMTEQQQRQRLNSKHKTVKMLLMVVIIFAICWLPINLFHVINDFFYFEDKAPIGYNTYLVCNWLAFSSVCWNPFIYFGLNQYYRQGLRKMFSFPRNTRNSSNSMALNTRSSALLSRNSSKESETRLKNCLKCERDKKDSVKTKTVIIDKNDGQRIDAKCCLMKKNCFE